MNIDLTVLEVDSLCLQIILTFVTIIFCLSLVKNSWSNNITNPTNKSSWAYFE